ncbi:MAG TPA: hypothetical protein VF263_24275 [Longimicrobiaceae bacterium]
MRRVTALILLLGIAAVAYALLTPERRRAREMRKVAVGTDAARVAGVLGPPADTCPTGSLDHLRTRFPVGTAPAAMEQAIVRMQRETAERWVYPLKEGGRAGCVPAEGATEVGIDRRRRVLWYVPVTGHRPVEVPAGYLPAGT